jgi:8-amino-7-oxononanoate synthase
MSKHHSIQNELANLADENLHRELRDLPHTGGKFQIGDKEFLNFSSNDYLDLANNEQLKNAAIKTIGQMGCGATSSRLMTGHTPAHVELESALAAFTNMNNALVFPSGYQANLAVLTSLADPNGVIFSDALNHASIVDGCRLSKSPVEIYGHNDMNVLSQALEACSAPGRKIIVTDTLFSMDGDQANLVELDRLARRFDAYLVVDEAHAMGVYGEGKGLCRECGIKPDVLVGTLTKSFGSGGGFAASTSECIELIVNKARSFIFSTGLAPVCAGTALEAIRIISEQPHLGKSLLEKAALFRQLLNANEKIVEDGDSQIIPLIIGSNDETMKLSAQLFDRGIIVSGIRPPTVPEGSSRLRFSITLAHTEEDLHRAASIICTTLSEFRVLK